MLPGTKIYKLPDDMRLRLGALSEPLTSCIRAFNRATQAGGFTLGRHGRHPGLRARSASWPSRRRRRWAPAASSASARRRAPRLELARKFGAEATVDIEAVTTPEARISAVRDIVGGFGADLVMDCSGHPSAGPGRHRVPARRRHLRRDGPVHRRGLDRDLWHRICAKDLNVLGSWAFTGNDLPLGVDMLYRARDKYPWLDMQTLYPFTDDGRGAGRRGRDGDEDREVHHRALAGAAAIDRCVGGGSAMLG